MSEPHPDNKLQSPRRSLRRPPMVAFLSAMVAILAISVIILSVVLIFATRSENSLVQTGETMTAMQHTSSAARQGMAGHDMSPVNVTDVPSAPIFARGQQPLESALIDGVKEYRLTPQVVRWSILPTAQVGAYTYNGTVPGPMVHLTPGERVRFLVENRLPEPTSVHWHGLQVENAQDGAANITQQPIKPGETFTYEWTVPPTPGTFFYHSHFQADRQQALGLYGALIIDSSGTSINLDVDIPILLGEWTVTEEGNLPAMDMSGMEPNFFTINGKSYPETETINVKVGQKVRLRLVGSGQFIHPMHLHGQPFTVVATDGNSVPPTAQFTKDTILVGPGERYDVEFVARAPGKWLFHCHINHHTTNDGREEQGAGGLTMIVNVAE